MTDLHLPLTSAGPTPGASFTEFLRSSAPHLLPGGVLADGPVGSLGSSATAGGSGAGPDIAHGTTILSMRYADGVIMAGDRRATEGHTIANRNMEKVYAADQLSAVGIAGAAGPAMEMVRLFQTELEHYEKVSGEPLSMEGKSNKLSQMVKANLPAAFQGLVVVPLYCGWDERRRRGRVFRYDVTGGRYEDADYATTGSGGVHARNWIKAFWHAEIDRDAAIDLSITSLFQAADEDSATGGPDLIRRIFPMVTVIDAGGLSWVTEEELSARAERLVNTPAMGGGLRP